METQNINFKTYLNSLRQRGNLAYEYNPFYNYQIDEDLFLVNDQYLIPYQKAINIDNYEILNNNGTLDYSQWIDSRGRVIDNIITWEGKKFENNLMTTNYSSKLYAKAGSIIDLDTNLLNFDLEHPVEIEVQPSYDGSVNLILNDDKNIPRLINSRFSVREKDTYEIVDRIGENDTNIYNSKTFDKDTSLYFQYKENPILNYSSLIQGILPVGTYCFYFTYCDSDDNESDIIAESGPIPIFIGDDGNPFSMDGGIKNQNSNKGVYLELNNLDKSYNYLRIYYVRYFADYNQNRVYEAKKIYKKHSFNSNSLYLSITGNEETEDVDANILNLSRFNPKNVLTQAQCKNMLFFGNIVKNSDNYKELSDLALRIIPELNVENFNFKLDSEYNNSQNTYYNSTNIYNKTGYFNQEYYRFGVVFIYENGTLSNVYNTLGGILNESNNLKLSGNIYTIYSEETEYLLKRNYIKIDNNGWIKQDNSYELSGQSINSKGVCKINYTQEYTDSTIFSIKFNVPKEVSKFLKEELGIRGLFFVRQKCIPNILAQCYILDIDKELEAPIIKLDGFYYSESFLVQNEEYKGNLSNNYEERLIQLNNLNNVNSYAGICPDFLLNQPYYNQIFNGSQFILEKISSSNYSLFKNERFYNEDNLTSYKISNQLKKVTINTVTENVSTVAIKDKIFRLNIGCAEESYRFRYVGNGESNNDENYEATNIVRGIYSPYIAIYSKDETIESNCLYNIYRDSNISEIQEFQNRMDSSEPFYAISNRYNLNIEDKEFICYRGDCYINQFTYRLNRNFNDPSLPNNDQIIDAKTWIDNYKESPEGDAKNLVEQWEKISRSDINAVQLGSWITFRVRSAMNYALRSEDHSYVSEKALMGGPRSFYPRSSLLYRGANKMPDSYLYNDAYRISLGFKSYYTLQDINYIKDTFSNRIQYSAIAIQDSYKNNYRESYSTYFRDYSQEYGSIQKLIGFEGYLLVVFEHAIAVAVINERVLAGTGDGEPVFINTNNVLPEELTIITDTYGTQWGESVIKSEAGYVYGVDTIAKKIWRVKGQQIEILSDFKVNKFLIDNISLGEREKYPIIGLKNVKTHYNNNKKDIMFTFYDDVYQDEEKVWNLCYNELLGEFITFYSWVPSFSENIDTKFFSFNRNTSKYLALLNKNNYAIPENTGVLVGNPVITLSENDTEIKIDLYYETLNKSQVINYTIQNEDGTTITKTISKDGKEGESGRYFLENIKFKLEKDHWHNYELFDCVYDENEDKTYLRVKNIQDFKNKILGTNEIPAQKVLILYVTPYLDGISEIESGTTYQTQFHTESIAITLSEILNNPLLTKADKEKPALTTDFYLHGKAGIFNVVENLYPTFWYGEQHPFEFEFVVNDNIAQQKVFNNLVIISNKAEPESFHFEIEGDNYEFSSDKVNMYFRQEATKNLYQNLGSDILYNRYYTDVFANKYLQEYYNRSKQNSKYSNQYKKMDKVYPIIYDTKNTTQQVKSTIFPLYYEKIDKYNDIYHTYEQMQGGDRYDFKNLSGSEILWDRDLNQFNIVTHIKNSPIDLVGRMRGNSFYKEGKWNIQIPSISFMQKNEQEWPKIKGSLYKKITEEGPIKDDNKVIPPIVINSQYLPKDLKSTEVTLDILPNIYKEVNENGKYIIDTNNWTYRKETNIRDKWMKVRIRYSGKNLAIIHSIATLYNISYS